MSPANNQVTATICNLEIEIIYTKQVPRWLLEYDFSLCALLLWFLFPPKIPCNLAGQAGSAPQSFKSGGNILQWILIQIPS
jgi:hypothetical protein